MKYTALFVALSLTFPLARGSPGQKVQAPPRLTGLELHNAAKAALSAEQHALAAMYLYAILQKEEDVLRRHENYARDVAAQWKQELDNALIAERNGKSAAGAGGKPVIARFLPENPPVAPALRRLICRGGPNVEWTLLAGPSARLEFTFSASGLAIDPDLSNAAQLSPGHCALMGGSLDRQTLVPVSVPISALASARLHGHGAAITSAHGDLDRLSQLSDPDLFFQFTVQDLEGVLIATGMGVPIEIGRGVKAPDLLVEYVEIDGQRVKAGSTFHVGKGSKSVRVSVMNGGLEDAGIFALRFTPLHLPGSSQGMRSLPPGASSTDAYDYFFNEWTPRNWEVQVDASEHVNESDEQNNIFRFEVVVQS